MEPRGNLLNVDMAAQGRRESYPSKVTIYRQGEVTESSAFLVTGTVKLSVIGVDGEEQILWYVEEGRIFYDPGMVLGKPNGASAVTVTECQVITFPRKLHFDLIYRYGEFAQLCIISMAEIMQGLGKQVAALALNDRFGLVAKGLLYFGRRNLVGNKNAAGAVPLMKISVTQQELADFAGINRVTVANVLKVLTENQVIAKRPREITILQPDELYRMAKC